MITLVLHDHMTDIKKLLQQKVAFYIKNSFYWFRVKEFFNFADPPYGFFKSLLSQILSTNSSGWDTSISNTPLSFL
ncbi:hypothetical protein GLOIN_2v882189 [Rhizophagus irregularis DAOM 181602=DAOM 197198]|nr:hypothetical protein GLOIN_2v882189 [Rhizophagus irregularis DAOM 181602=DAOM 197198]